MYTEDTFNRKDKYQIRQSKVQLQFPFFKIHLAWPRSGSISDDVKWNCNGLLQSTVQISGPVFRKILFSARHIRCNSELLQLISQFNYFNDFGDLRWNITTQKFRFEISCLVMEYLCPLRECEMGKQCSFSLCCLCWAIVNSPNQLTWIKNVSLFFCSLSVKQFSEGCFAKSLP